MARRVAFGLGSAAATAARANPASARSPAPIGATLSRAMSPVVIVPVLSRQITSTRARVSTAGSSWTRVSRRASRTTPTANAIVVISTSPSGTMETTPPTVLRSASGTEAFARSWLNRSRAAVGTSPQLTSLMTRLMPVISSDRARVKRRASSARVVAYALAPTRVAR